MSSGSASSQNGGAPSQSPSSNSREQIQAGIQGPQNADMTNVRAPRTEQELAQAFRDLTRGEQTASALEANLASLESKLDELLASFDDMGAAGVNGADVADGKRAGPRDEDDAAGK